MRMVALLVACTSAACYPPDLQPGAPCPDNVCPLDQTCSNGFCAADGDGGNGGDVTPFSALDHQFLSPCHGAASTAGQCKTDDDIFPDLASVEGDPNRTYQVTIHVRGVVELAIFDGGAMIPSSKVNIGGSVSDDARSDFDLIVDAPFNEYHLNSDTTNSSGAVVVDYHATISVTGGAMIQFSIDTQDDKQADNPSGLTVSGVTTTPSPYDGQFLDVHVTAVQ